MKRMTSGAGPIAWMFATATLIFATAMPLLTRSVGAAEPVALIVGINGGATEPALQTFSEIQDGAELMLEQGARVTFLHYQRCEEVTVESGMLTLRTGSYRIVGGHIVGRTARGCPKTGTLETTREVGGVLFRGDIALQLSPSATLVIIGPGADEIDRARIESSAGELAGTIEVSEGIVDLEALSPRMKVGEEFSLELLKRSGAPALRVSLLSALMRNDFAVIRVE
ncbi:MAG: hypothetical protein ABJO52_02785 [Nisaea sp.]|uniref:hypothetical protein n=1 Tax=Nisaea sp. TaxID=2024842 RepID=UPI003296C609